MKKVQTLGDSQIYQKRSGRYAVQDKNKKWVNAEEKTKILLEAGLIKLSAPNPAASSESDPGSEDQAPTETAGDEDAST